MNSNVEQILNASAKELNVEPAALKAIAEVESQGEGFYENGEVKILYEKHIFYRQLSKKYGKVFADKISKNYPTLCNSVGGSYGKFSEQHPKLRAAESIDKDSARESCSWGAYQVLGVNWKSLGYESIQKLVNDAMTEEGQARMLVRFLKANPNIIKALQDKNWRAVAKGYNGVSYEKFNYHIKLETAYNKLK